ncbi:unnamed protein product [Darwinula stevensoni]|uniref:D-isomer specific 2-hydroxyacid dehydrogenase NAD-binding domain-containing protein n=1 Tax=Darwinula stevensoni TaxID=69355 RepID=A0A7R8XDY3_9CRUS|nr:unnamed protein product [Darwinula stevensoni]CAG0895246.1 unnamed protein product [Darwinula stevensoni]
MDLPGDDGASLDKPYKLILDTKVPSGVIKELESAEILLADGHLLGQILYALPNLKWAQTTYAGVERIMKGFFPEKGKPTFTVTRFSGDHFGKQMSEYVLAQVVNFERKFFLCHQNQSQGKWIADGNIKYYRLIKDMTCGVMGVGKIGMEICRTLHHFGGRVKGLGRCPKLDLGCEATILSDYKTVKELDNFLSDLDLLVCVLPNTPETCGLLNNGMLKNCKNQPLFVNIGRGSLILEEEILKALNERWIRGAILDVFNEEPLPSNHPLWSHQQVVVTPHVSGITRLQEVVTVFSSQLQKFSDGQPLDNVLDWDAGY